MDLHKQSMDFLEELPTTDDGHSDCASEWSLAGPEGDHERLRKLESQNAALLAEQGLLKNQVRVMAAYATNPQGNAVHAFATRIQAAARRRTAQNVLRAVVLKPVWPSEARKVASAAASERPPHSLPVKRPSDMLLTCVWHAGA